ncbi:MAG: type II CAAX endopeptidase family protein [Dehalococcoidales bacterium]|nr:type II CAAX endopeptidase family protein [Dehalococcoidales bacterium]MDZ4230244.1 type II CAAX endopeptidase family protein [Dehalococcoidales bacterium]
MQAITEIVQSELLERRVGRWQVFFIVALMAGIVVSEYVFAYHNVAYGIVIALALVLFTYLSLSVLHLQRGIINCGESLALVPLYILFTSSLPWFFINQQFLLPAVYSCIMGLCFWHIYEKGLSLSDLFGFSKEKLLKYSLIGLAIGVPLGTVEYLILRPAPAFPGFEVRYLFRDMVYMFFFVGIGEELLFRALIQRDLADVFGWKWGLLGASFLFAVMHLTWRSVPELGFVFIAGIVLGALYLKTKSLTAPIIAHGVNNVMLVAVLPYLIGL